ncbi:MAG: proprotein convertase P-domain-containing protein [Spirosomataceae bacterium]
MKNLLLLKSAAWLLCIFYLCGASRLQAQTFSATGLPAGIPDPGNIAKTITVSGLSGTVADANEVQVNFAISHGWAGDIKVGITAPGGSEIIIVNTIGNGSSGPVCYSNSDYVSQNTITISQSAGGQLPGGNGITIPAGTYLPTGCVNNSVGTLASLTGSPRNGDWTIKVYDVEAIFSGTLHLASITFTGVCTTPPTPTIMAGGPTALCGSGSVTLTSSAASGNQWYKDGNILTGETNQTYTATDAGSYTVVVSASGCSSQPSTPTVVAVNPVPAPPAIMAGGPTAFCAGGSVTLTSSAASGNQWYKDNNLINGATNPTYTADASGNYTVTATVAGCTSQPSAPTTVTVKPVPGSNLIASKVDVCPNTEVTLNAQCTIPNSIVNWNPGAPTVTPDAPNVSYVYKASCSFDGCIGNESSIEVRTHRILVDLKNIGNGTQPKAIAGPVKDNLAPTNTIPSPASPRLWTIIANGCSASESGVFKLSGPVNFSSIDNNPPYAIFANVGSDYFAIDHPNYGNGTGGFPNGTYNLTVELRGGDGVGGPFPKNRVATGALLATRSLQFTITNPLREGVAETVAVSPSELNEEAWMSVGQNPVNTEVVVRLSGRVGQSIDLALVNLQGQPVQQRSVVLNSVQQYEVLNVSQAASGMYVLKAVRDNQVKTLKVVKMP